jgi:hypothetical protein
MFLFLSQSESEYVELRAEDVLLLCKVLMLLFSSDAYFLVLRILAQNVCNNEVDDIFLPREGRKCELLSDQVVNAAYGMQCISNSAIDNSGLIYQYH